MHATASAERSGSCSAHRSSRGRDDRCDESPALGGEGVEHHLPVTARDCKPGVPQRAQVMGDKALCAAHDPSELEVEAEHLAFVGSHPVILTLVDTKREPWLLDRSGFHGLSNVVEDVGDAQIGAGVQVRDPDAVAIEDPNVGGVKVRVSGFCG